MELVKDKSRAMTLADSLCPKIIQEWSKIFDFLSPIQLGSMDEVIARLHSEISKPTLYYSVREDDEHVYVLYMTYHAYDYSLSDIIIVKELDSHRHDSESILIRYNKETQKCDMITVCHNTFKFESPSLREVCIERGSHAIRPLSEKKPRGNFITYQPGMIDLFRIEDWDIEYIQRLQKSFHKVNLPWQQYDERLIGSPSGRMVNKRGDIYHRPNRVFESAKLKGWLS